MDKPKDRTFAVLDREVQDLLRVSFANQFAQSVAHWKTIALMHAKAVEVVHRLAIASTAINRMMFSDCAIMEGKPRIAPGLQGSMTKQRPIG